MYAFTRIKRAVNVCDALTLFFFEFSKQSMFHSCGLCFEWFGRSEKWAFVSFFPFSLFGVRFRCDSVKIIDVCLCRRKCSNSYNFIRFMDLTTLNVTTFMMDLIFWTRSTRIICVLP